MGPKPFFQKDDAFVVDLFTELFKTYRQLLKDCETAGLCWWLGEGSDLLEYDRDMTRRIHWAQWQGFAKTAAESGIKPPVCYTDNPIEITYGDIRRIIALAKRCCQDVLGKSLRVALPFDPGSEFCISPFRYERHPEILMKGWGLHHVDAIARFKGDTTRYAAYPDGIPDGTPFGEFFGKQARLYLEDMGADAIWFSNSFGFGRSPYASGGTGQFFDGETFHPDGNRAVHDAVVEFWDCFRRHCPDVSILCRGTDFPVGVNLVNHASAYQAVYEGNRYGITPPPNTPWSALTHNHGLALAGYLTQNGPFPGERMSLRFYTTDQWFCNNPWFDRWDRSPHDVYLSASMCKLLPSGKVGAFNTVHVMGVDGSWGELVSEVADEVVPHLKRAAALKPDAIPPLLWVYPFDEHNAQVFGEENRMDEPYGGDLSISCALNHAFPLAGIVTTANLGAALAEHGPAFRATVLVSPPPEPGSVWERLLNAHLDAGGKVLCYGTLKRAGDDWLKRLGLRADAAPVSGLCKVGGRMMDFDAPICQGGLCETADGATVLAAAAQGGETRVLASVRGRLAWVRGGANVTREGLAQRRMDVRDPNDWFPPESLYAVALAALGWRVEIVPGFKPGVATVFLVSRHANGWLFAGHSPDDAAALRVGAPMGAPVPLGRFVKVQDGASVFPIRNGFHDEVRVFVRQSGGIVGCHGQPVIAKELRRRWHVSGLKDATVRFYVEPGCKTIYYTTESPEFAHPRDPIVPELHADATGTWFELENHSGPLSIGWGVGDDLKQGMAASG
ncbi:MAG: hypothetical protein ACOX9C_05650 [Kiritimatiellia bacterium]